MVRLEPGANALPFTLDYHALLRPLFGHTAVELLQQKAHVLRRFYLQG